MKRRRIWVRRVLLIALAGLAVEQAWRHGHDYIWPDKFKEVVPGKVYRGAWQQPWPMRSIVRDHKIRTILALAHPDGHPLAVREKALAQELGCRWVHIPIVDDQHAREGEELNDLLERAAAVVADPDSQPVYFHCHHGVNRASMVQIAYRTLYCGWTLERANDEVSRTFGLVEVSRGPDYRRMARFYEDHVLPRRRARTAAAATGAERR